MIDLYRKRLTNLNLQEKIMKNDFIYDSSEMTGEKNYSFKRKHDDSFIFFSYIFFEKENVYLQANEDGNVIFSDVNGIELFRDKADGQGRCFFEFYCEVKNGTISVRFPIQEVIDHYPNCDGEYDRYSYITRDNVMIEYKL